MDPIGSGPLGDANAMAGMPPPGMPMQHPTPQLSVKLKEASVGLTRTQPSADGSKKGESQIAVGMTLQLPITELVNCLLQFKHKIAMQASEQVHANQV